MNSVTTKVLAAVLTVLLFATIGSQIYYFINDEHETEEAVLCTINEDVTFDSIIVRDEKVINGSKDGILDYLCDDGNKVSVGSVIANIYSSNDDVVNQQRISKIMNEISVLNRAQNPGTINYVQPDTLRTKIDTEYKRMLSYSLSNNYTALDSSKNDLSVVIDIYNIITGNVTDYNEQINSLKEQVKSLRSASKAIGQIKSQQTGYFVSYADGYEDKLNTKNVGKLSEDAINSIIKAKPAVQRNVIGKMLNDYSCKIVGIVKADKRIAEGASLTLTLSSSKLEYDVTVDSVRPAKEDGKLIAVFSCDRLDKALVNSRVQSAKIVFDEYQGIKVPRKAIRFKGEDKGVYVLLGQDVIFKKIEVIYENEDEDFVLSENTSDEEHLLLYDQILMEVISDKDVSDSNESS